LIYQFAEVCGFLKCFKKIGEVYFILKLKTGIKYLNELNLGITDTNESFGEFTMNVNLIIQ